VSSAADTKKIVFLDRDGTLNVDYGYVTHVDQLDLYPGVANAIARLKAAGFYLVVVTNQSAVGRGMCSPAEVDGVNAELMRRLLAADSGARLDEIVYCPHTPEDGCDCRKPKVGLVQNLQFSAADSWLVGDKRSDLQFGLNAGITPTRLILVLTGHGEDELAGEEEAGTLNKEFVVCKNLVKAVDKILGQ
jgi:histidinol-phosphate phosphatase family protein